MNIEGLHPILVHFPIALLSLYAILECLRFKKLLAWQPFFYIKAFLVIVGGLAGIAAYSTGPEGMAVNGWSGYASMVGSNGRPFVDQIVNMHSNFASLTLGIFSVIAVSYLVVWIQKIRPIQHSAWSVILKIANFIQKPAVIILLALLGLLAVTITGALGGSIVYGPNVDPVVSYAYHLFF
jgi:uncharacterized membrane protein